MKDDVVDQEETKSTTSRLPPQPTPVHPPSPTPTIHLQRWNSLVFPTPLQTLSLLHIEDRRHSFAFPNGDATTIPLLSKPPSFDAGLTPFTSTSSLCYTSLRDLISSASSSAAMNSPASSSPIVSACYQIPIRNRLVKQAAWAYLQPMSSSLLSSSSHSQLFFSRLWDCLSSWHPLEGLTEYVKGCFLPAVQKILDRIGHTVRWLMARLQWWLRQQHTI